MQTHESPINEMRVPISLPEASDREFLEAAAAIAKLNAEYDALPDNPGDEITDPIWERISALSDWILSTPAAGLAGVAIKLRILDEWTQVGPHARDLDLLCIGQVRAFVDNLAAKENLRG